MEMAGYDNGAIRGEAKKDDAEDGIDEAEEGRTNSLRGEANDNDQRGEPGHQACGHHQDSPPWGFGAQDGMGKREPVRCDADPVNHG